MAIETLYVILVPSFVLFTGILERRWGPYFAGALQGVPVVAFPIFVILVLTKPIEFVQKAALFGLLGTLPWLGFVAIYQWSSTKSGPSASYATAAATWTVLALAISLPCGICRAVLFFLGMLSFAAIVRYRIDSIDASGTRIKKPLGARVVFSLLIATIVIYLSDRVGSTWTGIIATYPVSASTLLFFNHIHGSEANVGLVARGLLFGVVPLSVFMFMIFFFLGWIAGGFALVAALLVSILLTIALMFLCRGSVYAPP